jgi:hypothetical protein
MELLLFSTLSSLDIRPIDFCNVLSVQTSMLQYPVILYFSSLVRYPFLHLSTTRVNITEWLRTSKFYHQMLCNPLIFFVYCTSRLSAFYSNVTRLLHIVIASKFHTLITNNIYGHLRDVCFLNDSGQCSCLVSPTYANQNVLISFCIFWVLVLRSFTLQKPECTYFLLHYLGAGASKFYVTTTRMYLFPSAIYRH